MKQLERLKQIYLMLSHDPQTIESIQSALKAQGVKVSNRQLYRDLDDVGMYFLRQDERLDQRYQEFNRKIYVINKDSQVQAIDDYDIDTYLISRLVVPAGIKVGRKHSLSKFKTIFAGHLNNSKVEYNSNWDGISMLNTHFNEIPFDEQFQVRLNEVLWSVANHRSIEITSYDGDSVSLYRSLTIPFIFQPLKILYHRGSFFVAGLIASSGRCLVLDLFQVTGYKLSNQSFPFKKQLPVVEQNLNGRFGITQNINEEVYDVILEFSSITGGYVMAHIWHHSQRQEMTKNGNLRVFFKCGINRELLGWIYMWMGNVKIIQPQILKDYYCEQFKLIQEAYNSDYLAYNNISQPD